MRQVEKRLEDLECGGLKIMQASDLYCFSSDAVILANVLQIRDHEKAVEIGMGSGVISILACAKTKVHCIIGFEMQQKMAELAKENIALNQLESKITVVEDRVQNFKKYIPQESIDVVFSNPPYMKEVQGIEKNVRYFGRHDDTLKLNELCDCTSKMLKHGGRFYLVYAAERMSELIISLVKTQLQPKRIFFTENGKGRVVLVVVEAIKGAASGVKVLPNVITNDRDGNYLEALKTKYFI